LIGERDGLVELEGAPFPSPFPARIPNSRRNLPVSLKYGEDDRWYFLQLRITNF